MPFHYKIGHCILLNANRYVIKEINEDKAFIVHISDPLGHNGKWIFKSLLPIPFTKIKV